MTKKTVFMLLTFFAVMLSLSLFTYAETTYLVPRRDTPPVIDGDGSDDAWSDALRINLTVGEVGKNGGWTTEEGATGAKATVRAVWSGNENARGLYFLVEVTDATPSLPADYNASDLCSQDGFQIVIDPFYKRFQTSTEGTLRYSFVPYTRSTDTKSEYGYACWREDLFWRGGMIKALGINMEVRLKYNSVTERVNGYVAEIFLPFSALSVGGLSFDSVEEYDTHIGIGFLLTDYTYSVKTLSTGDYEGARILKGIVSDYGSSEEDLQKPSAYCTLYFGKESLPGTVLHSSEKTDAETPVSVVTVRDQLERTISSLVKLSENDFTVDSWKTMQDAYNRALLISRMETATQEQIDTAADDLSDALFALQPVGETKPSTTIGSQKTEEYLHSAVLFCCIVFSLGAVFLALVLIRHKHMEKEERE